MSYLFAILCAAGYGFNDFCVYLGSRSGRATSSQALVINLFSGNILLVIVASVLYLTQGMPHIDWPGMLSFIAAGIAGPFLGRIFSITAIRNIGATRTTSLRVSETFFSMFLAVALLRNIIPIRSLAGAIILILGIIILINETNKGSQRPKAARRLSALTIGSLFALIASLFFAIAGIFRLTGSSYSPSAISGTLVGSMVALVTNAAFAYFSRQLGSHWTATRREVLFYSLGGLGNSTAMLMFFLALIAGGHVALVTALKNISPLFTLFFSWIFLRKVERFTVMLVVSILIVIFGAFLIVM